MSYVIQGVATILSLRKVKCLQWECELGFSVTMNLFEY